VRSTFRPAMASILYMLAPCRFENTAVQMISVSDADENSAPNSRRFTQMSNSRLRHLSSNINKSSAVIEISKECETTEGGYRAKDEEKVRRPRAEVSGATARRPQPCNVDLLSETRQDMPFMYKVPPHPLGSMCLLNTAFQLRNTSDSS
jgi:hypothetical protein